LQVAFEHASLDLNPVVSDSQLKKD
jgi:hypothetical protein